MKNMSTCVRSLCESSRNVLVSCVWDIMLVANMNGDRQVLFLVRINIDVWI